MFDLVYFQSLNKIMLIPNNISWFLKYCYKSSILVIRAKKINIYKDVLNKLIPKNHLDQDNLSNSTRLAFRLVITLPTCP
ncbi:hypothetical protein BpHYR1_006246 [Brachionus plicatilis]|uniref:Uncharacterized protein n=1 Tax=Brachionus plicatilis TaxID=10195 RepID=A0A3M7RYT4_BRAPC|nr:hypothetical protein BpHYR1_006246 [Brachionus plicatilis]